MSNYSDFLAEQMKNPTLKTEYDVLDSAFSLIQAQIDAGKSIGAAHDRPDDKTAISRSYIAAV